MGARTRWSEQKQRKGFFRGGTVMDPQSVTLGSHHTLNKMCFLLICMNSFLEHGSSVICTVLLNSLSSEFKAVNQVSTTGDGPSWEEVEL